MTEVKGLTYFSSAWLPWREGFRSIQASWNEGAGPVNFHVQWRTTDFRWFVYIYAFGYQFVRCSKWAVDNGR